MEEDVSHHENSFDNQPQNDPSHSQAQLEPHALSAEADTLPTAVQAEPQIALASSRRRRSPFIMTLIVSLLVLILLLAGGGSIYAMQRPQIPGASALVRITPNSQLLSKTYTTDVTLNSTDPTLNPIGAHTIKIMTPTKSLTAPATGTHQVPATYATGIVNVYNPTIENPIFPAGNYIIKSNSGVSIEVFITSPLHFHQPRNVSARAVNPGTGGNIKSTDINANYVLSPGRVFYAENLQPFSGGRNGYNVTAVSQTDIDSATSQLTSQLQSELPTDKDALKSRLEPGEQLLDPDNIQCKPSVKANRSPGDQASDVTVTGTMTCRAIAYTPAKQQAYGASLLAKDAAAQWNGTYILRGQVQEKLQRMFDLGKTITFSLNVQGLYIFQLNPDLSAHFASLIAGQTHANAQALLLRQAGVGKISIQVSGGLGTALPSSPKGIQITILSGQG